MHRSNHPKFLLTSLLGLAFTASAHAAIWLTPEGPYTFRQQVYVATDAKHHPYVELRCFYQGALKKDEEHQDWPGGYGYGYPFVLDGWGPEPSEAAACTVTVYHEGRHGDVEDAETSFPVAP